MADKNTPHGPTELPFADVIPKYMYPSIPLVAGCLVGLLVWAVVLLFSNYPSQAEIDAARSVVPPEPQPVRPSGGTGIDPRRLNDAEGFRRALRGEEPLTAPGSAPAPEPANQPEVRPSEKPAAAPVHPQETWKHMEYRRDMAKYHAHLAGFWCGVFTGVLGWVILGYYYYQIHKNRPPEQNWRDVVQPSAVGPEDGMAPPYETAAEPAGHHPAGEESFEPPPGDGILYEDEGLEVPPDVSEPDPPPLEEEQKKDPPDETP